MMDKKTPTSLTLTVDSLSEHGEGLAKYDGDLIFISQVLPHELVEVELGEPFTPHSNKRPARLMRILKPSALRQRQFCVYQEQCAACPLCNFTYQGQLAYKQQLVENLLKQLGVDSKLLEPMVASPQQHYWRNKSIRYFKLKSGQLKSGFLQSRSNDLVPLFDCRAEPEFFGTIAQCFEQTLNQNFKDHEQCVKALQIRKIDTHYVALLIVTDALTQKYRAVLQDVAAQLKLAALGLLIKDKADNALLRGRFELLYGRAEQVISLNGLQFYVGLLSFLQVNVEVAALMYQSVLDFCGQGQLALDLCCGVGTMTLGLSRNFKQVIGIEIVSDAIAAAKKNTQLNKIDSVRFINADLSQSLTEVISAQVDAIICDPARVGIGEQNIKALARVRHGCRLCYIFCSMKALRRELPVLLASGFEIKKVQAFDMFPYTLKNEVVVMLVKS